MCWMQLVRRPAHNFNHSIREHAGVLRGLVPAVSTSTAISERHYAAGVVSKSGCVNHALCFRISSPQLVHNGNLRSSALPQ